jgi:chromosome segregation ATPase
VDLVSINSLDTTGRLKDLEATCEDLRRRLAEERQVKDNFEDLLTALKSELESSHNERDNLRDEIVPQLRARVEGLEAQAAQHEKLTYERTKMEQEMQTLRIENTNLANAQRQQQVDIQQKLQKFDSIAEEPLPTKSRAMTLSRSNSVAHGAVSKSRPSSLTRSSSVKMTESREALAERVKDIELQRDSLHRALKSLLERQEYQNRENQKKIRQLEMERDRALSDSPRRAGYNREVSYLRDEINTLRRRADEAIEQKWQCEKGLGGLKMDLDRAEQEIGSLRHLLQENDILIPSGRPQSGSRPISGHVSSATLESAYKDLQNAYVESLDRLKKLEESAPKDAETEKAMKQLEQSLAAAISERDFASMEADSLRKQSDSLKVDEKSHVGEQLALSEELRNSAQRVEELAIQVRQQLSVNSTLRKRLAETIERGEKDQNTNAQKIMMMQSKLKTLEDQLMAAQQASEDKIAKHEEEIKGLKDSHNIQLQRVKEGLRSPRLFGPKSPLSPLFANSAKMPNLMSTSSGKGLSVSEDSQMEFLKQRVMDLERALADADHEMEEVVGRMNVAQIEVMELQNEREEAQRETRKLQRAIEEERAQASTGIFAALTS